MKKTKKKKKKKKNSFPLFLTSSEWIRLIDTTTSNPFFKDKEQHGFGDKSWIEGQLQNQRKEINYDSFFHNIWPRMTQANKNPYHPSLVFTEIFSYIKGSAEALENGKPLDLKKYEQLGRKRCPNFEGNRSIVYDLFKKYEKTKNDLGW